MREIKFRAWAKKEKEFVPSNIEWSISSEGLFCFTGEGGGLISYDEDYKLMQFTGLHDRNGKEIYEGDILCDVVERGKEQPTFLYKVEWADDIGPGWFSMAPRGRCFLKEMRMSLYEIIGNIYENPELLK